MKLCYQVATPDVKIDPSVTAFQGDLETSLQTLSSLGYDGVEFMTINPQSLDQPHVKALLEKYNLICSLVCTGEIYGQLQLSYSDPDENKRKLAIEKTKQIIDFAAFLHADINIGRVRGFYRDDVSKEQTEKWTIQALQELSDYALPKHVRIAIESVFIMQTNFLNTVGEAVALIRRVGRDNCRVMADLFHLNIEEKDMFKTIQDYKEDIIYVHLADNNRRYPGHCSMDYDRVFQTFYDIGYNGAFCTEIMQIPDQLTSATKSIAFLRPIAEKYYKGI